MLFAVVLFRYNLPPPPHAHLSQHLLSSILIFLLYVYQVQGAYASRRGGLEQKKTTAQKVYLLKYILLKFRLYWRPFYSYKNSWGLNFCRLYSLKSKTSFLHLVGVQNVRIAVFCFVFSIIIYLHVHIHTRPVLQTELGKLTLSSFRRHL
jgi:hypothetical protein